MSCGLFLFLMAGGLSGTTPSAVTVAYHILPFDDAFRLNAVLVTGRCVSARVVAALQRRTLFAAR